LMSGDMAAAPSKMEYCVCTCKWTKSGIIRKFMVLGRPLRRYGKVAGRSKFICVLPMLKAKSKVMKKYERISVFPSKNCPNDSTLLKMTG
jgi:hypothetical protein